MKTKLRNGGNFEVIFVRTTWKDFGSNCCLCAD